MPTDIPSRVSRVEEHADTTDTKLAELTVDVRFIRDYVMAEKERRRVVIRAVTILAAGMTLCATLYTAFGNAVWKIFH